MANDIREPLRGRSVSAASEWYEALRGYASGADVPAASRRGLCLFQRQGMLAWVDAMADATPENPRHSAPEVELSSMAVLPNVQVDIAAVLADVALKSLFATWEPRRHEGHAA